MIRKCFITFFFLLGLVSIIAMFWLDWKMALCIFCVLWADRATREL